MDDIAGRSSKNIFYKIIFRLPLVLALAQACWSQSYTPVFKSLEVQATIAPLGEMVVGRFFGHTSVAAIAKSERAIYFFVPDSLENLILTNVVSLPDTPVAISAGRPVELEASDQPPSTRIAVLMKRNLACVVHFGKDGEPIVSQEVKTDSLCTGIRAADLEARGKLDIITFGRFSLGISVSRDLGDGKFAPPQPVRGSLGAVPFNDVAFADFNGDLVPDMAALDWVNHRLLIFYGRGDGSFAQPVSFQLAGEPSVLSVADLGGNGYPDIIVGYTRQNKVDIFGGDGFGRFFLRQTLKTSDPPTAFGVADFTGDGTLDIAAYSGESNQLTMFTYDPMAKTFRYAGVVGTGDAYRHIAPIYFPTRFRADLVASSPTQDFLKVLKTAVRFIKTPDMLVPVQAGSEFLAAGGDDSSNYLITADSSGTISAKYFEGQGMPDIQSAIDWHTQGSPANFKLLSADPVRALVSFKDVGSVSLYELSETTKDVKENRAGTQFIPTTVAGDLSNGNVVLAAASMNRTDSSLTVSFFSSTRTGDEFIEDDYTVPGKMNQEVAWLSVVPERAYFTVGSPASDTLVLCSAILDDRKEIYDTLKASMGRFGIPGRDAGFPNLMISNDDTLTIYQMEIPEPGSLRMHPIIAVPLDGGDFGSVRLAMRDSTWFVGYSNPVDGTVKLYESNGNFTRLAKSWRVSAEPTDICISIELNRIYFLNESESYVSIHSF